MSKYRALVFDIDGTAVDVNRNANPSPRLTKAIQAARGKLELLAATGRSIRYALPTLRAMGVTNPCVVAGGATIIDPVSGEILHQALVPIEAISQVQAAAKPFGYDVHLGSTPTTIRPATHGEPVGEPQPYILLEAVTDQDLTPLMQSLTHIEGIISAPSPDYFARGQIIQITSADGSKEHGVQRALAMLNINSKQAIGIGDADNDIHLFAAVGHKIAMGNASDQLKSIADEIAPSYDDDGLAVIIERYTKA